MNNLYLVEYYKHDQTIRFAWVGAETPGEALQLLERRITDRRGTVIGFAECITIGEHSFVVPLSCHRQPLFVDVPAPRASREAWEVHAQSKLTAYRVTQPDGTSWVTSMAAHVTLPMAQEYFRGLKVEKVA